jgi:hypothetical protein
MAEELTIIELRNIRRYLAKVYCGVSEQEELWGLAQKLDTIIERRTRESRRKPVRGTD